MSARWCLFISAVACFLIGVLCLIFISLFLRTFIFASLAITICASLAVGIFLLEGSIDLGNSGLVEDAMLEEILAVLCFVAAGVLACVAIFTGHDLSMAIAICSTTTTFAKDNLGVAIMPLLVGSCELCWSVYWVYALAAIVSQADVKEAPDVTHELNRFVVSDKIKIQCAYHVFMGFWLFTFWEGVITVATACVMRFWYFAPYDEDNKKPKSHCSWARGLFKTIVYHVGSIAMGSMILASCKVLQFVFHFFVLSNKHVQGQNAVVKMFVRCARTVINCFERAVKYVNFNAYLMIGITDNGFCGSVWEAFALGVRNPKRFAVFSGVMWTVNSILRLTILGGCMGVAAITLNDDIFPNLAKETRTPWPALLVAAIIGFYVSGLMADVYTTAGSSLFYCFCVDEEATKNSGLAGFGEHSPHGLRQFFDKLEHEEEDREQHKYDHISKEVSEALKHLH